MSLISNYLTIYSLYNVCSYVPKHWNRRRGYPVKKFVTITKSFISNCLTIYSLYNVYAVTFLNTGTEVVVILSKNLLQ